MAWLGDPAEMRAAAARVRMAASTIATGPAAAVTAAELSGNQGDFFDRQRETIVRLAHDERTAIERLEGIADAIERAAASVERAIAEEEARRAAERAGWG